jgi:hypothetical protein
VRILQDIFDSQLGEQLFPKLATKLIAKKFTELGITLTEEQLDDIKSRLQDLKGDTIAISIEDSQAPVLGPKLEVAIRGAVPVDMGDLTPDLNGLLSELSKSLTELIPKLTRDISAVILLQLKRDASSMLKERRKEETAFEARLAKKWRKPIDLLEMFLVIATEAGDDFNGEFRPAVSKENDYLFDALTRLHARACQITSEILTLLKSGHADGALARWRTLHEIAVTSFFIQAHGNRLAERYLLHEAVESCKAAEEYQRHYKKLGYEPLTKHELKEIRSRSQNLVKRFGDRYEENYGWAATIIHKRNNQLISFKDIEADAGLEHLRPFYRMASHIVHANPKGIFFKLGLYPDGEPILLAGPSNTGLADPIDATAIALNHVTTALLTLVPNIDRLVVCNVLLTLVDEIGEEALAAQKALEGN